MLEGEKMTWMDHLIMRLLDLGMFGLLFLIGWVYRKHIKKLFSNNQSNTKPLSEE